MRGLKTITLALVLTVFTASSGYATHERFHVAQMREVNPSENSFVVMEGACTPTHDREKLDCYFVTIVMSKPKSVYDDATAQKFDDYALKKEKNSLCSNFNQPPSAANLAEATHNIHFRKFLDAVKAFCAQPSRDTAHRLYQAMAERKSKTCICLIKDFRATFVRQGNRWIASMGPSGRCGETTVEVLEPVDLKDLNTPSGPSLWTFTEKVVLMLKDPKDPKCDIKKHPLLAPPEGTVTLSWNGPRKSLACEEFEFNLALLGGIAEMHRHVYREFWSWIPEELRDQLIEMMETQPEAPKK